MESLENKVNIEEGFFRKNIRKVSRYVKGLAGAVVFGTAMLFSSGNSEASIVENLQTAEQPIITMLDYRNGPLEEIGSSNLFLAQSFIALDNYIIDGSLKLKRGEANYTHNMYLKIWPDDNGIPDVENEIGTTNALIPKGLSLEDYYWSEFGGNAVRVTEGERYWLGLYNPDLNDYAFAQFFSWEYGYINLYPDGYYGRKGRVDMPWTIFNLESRDIPFSVTFSNIPEPKLLELLGFGVFWGLLAYNRRKNK